MPAAIRRHDHTLIMLPIPLLFASALAFNKLWIAPVRATALTTAIAANERLCFYADVDKAGEKLGVRPSVAS